MCYYYYCTQKLRPLATKTAVEVEDDDEVPHKERNKGAVFRKVCDLYSTIDANNLLYWMS